MTENLDIVFDSFVLLNNKFSPVSHSPDDTNILSDNNPDRGRDRIKELDDYDFGSIIEINRSNKTSSSSIEKIDFEQNMNEHVWNTMESINICSEDHYDSSNFDTLNERNADSISENLSEKHEYFTNTDACDGLSFGIKSDYVDLIEYPIKSRENSPIGRMEEIQKTDNDDAKIPLNQIKESDFGVNIIHRDLLENNDFEERGYENIDHLESDLMENQIKDEENIPIEIIEDIQKTKDETVECVSKSIEDDCATQKLEVGDPLNEIDESDFRVNIIHRDISADTWSTNLYIHNDNLDIENPFQSAVEEIVDELCPRPLSVEETANIDDPDPIKSEEDISIDIIEDIQKREDETIYCEDDCTTQKLEVDDPLNEVDESDFRVNIIHRDISADTWSTNLYIHNDNFDIDNPFQSAVDVEEICLTDNEVKAVQNTDDDKPTLFDDHANIRDNIAPIIRDIEVESVHSTSSIHETGTADDQPAETHDSPDMSSGTGHHGNAEAMVIAPVVTEHDATRQTISSAVDHIEQRPETGTDLPDAPAVLREQIAMKPIGINNSSNFRSWNAIVGMLFNCSEFRDQMINYHHSDQIAELDFDSHTDISVGDACFVNDLCKLFSLMMEGDETKGKNIGRSLRQYFQNRLDLHDGFLFILDKINAVTKSVVNDPITSSKKEDISFHEFRNKNHGFVTDLFYGQTSHSIHCANCYMTHCEEYIPMSCVSLKISCQPDTTLESCLNSYFCESRLNTDDTFRCCSKPIIKGSRTITHAPRYMFIFLDRRLETGKRDKTLIETDNGIVVSTANGLVLYSLCSIIDYVDFNIPYYYVVKCLSNQWWIISDRKAHWIQDFEVIGEYNVGFMMKREDDH